MTLLHAHGLSKSFGGGGSASSSAVVAQRISQLPYFPGEEMKRLLLALFTLAGLFSPAATRIAAAQDDKRIAELEQEAKYWKEKAEGFEKEIYKLKVQLNMSRPKKGKPAAGADEPDAAEGI